MSAPSPRGRAAVFRRAGGRGFLALTRALLWSLVRGLVLALVLALAWALLAPAAGADPPAEPTTRLTLLVSGLPSSKGTVRAALFRGARGFPSDTEHAAVLREVPIEGGRATVVFEAAPCARGCAVALFHDENGNRDLDRSWAGIPSEAIGISRNALGIFGPRGYREAEFRSQEPDLTLSIEMRRY